MSNAPLVLALAIIALVLIYLSPHFDDALRKAYGRWRRRQREAREERERRERLGRRQRESPQ